MHFNGENHECDRALTSQTSAKSISKFGGLLTVAQGTHRWSSASQKLLNLNAKRIYIQYKYCIYLKSRTRYEIVPYNFYVKLGLKCTCSEFFFTFYQQRTKEEVLRYHMRGNSGCDWVISSVGFLPSIHL